VLRSPAMRGLENIVEKAIAEFHEKFYPEVVIKFIGMSEEGRIALYFLKHCYLTCGMYDYLEDFLGILNRYVKEKFVIEDKKQINMGYDGFVAVLAPRDIARPSEERTQFIILGNKGELIEVREVGDL